MLHRLKPDAKRVELVACPSDVNPLYVEGMLVEGLFITDKTFIHTTPTARADSLAESSFPFVKLATCIKYIVSTVSLPLNHLLQH